MDDRNLTKVYKAKIAIVDDVAYLKVGGLKQIREEGVYTSLQ